MGFAARLAYFALAPFGVVLCAALFPVAGTLVGIAVALVVFFTGEALRARAASSWLIREGLARELSFEEYYRTHPPRPFAYYVFYPLLFPYWLSNREARREFWLFKGYTAFGVVLLLATTFYQYFFYWQPQLSFRDFAPVLGLTLAAEAVLVLSLLMPLVTTVVAFHQSGRRRRLLVLLLVGLLSTGLSIHRITRRRDPVISYATRVRVRLRSAHDPPAAHAARLAAVRAALPLLASHPDAIDRDGKVEEQPLEQAQQVLERFYKSDESLAFDLWASPRQHPDVLVLYTDSKPGQSMLWTALHRDGHEIKDLAHLPPNALTAMRRAARR